MLSTLRTRFKALPRPVRLAIGSLVGLLGAFLLVAAVYGIDRAMTRGEVLRNVGTEALSLSGLDEEGVRAEIAGYEDVLVADPAIVVVAGMEFALQPETVGFGIDADAVVARAMAVGRTGGPIDQFGSWLSRFRTEVIVEVPVTLDAVALDEAISAWEDIAIEDKVFEGAITVSEGVAVADPPRTGQAVDRDQARALVLAALADPNRPRIDLPLTTVTPDLTTADLEAAEAEANLLINGTVQLVRSRPGRADLTLEITGDQLAAALRSRVVREPRTMIELSFDFESVETFLAPLRADLELPPRDAEFRINADDTVTLVPSQPGTLLEAEDVALALFEAAKTPTRTGDLPITEGAEPAFTTADAEAMGPIEMVSDFTTNHNCCERRVTNIQKMADIVDGHIVQPGERFSLNEFVGRRTEDKGFVPAPMIRNGVLEDDIGGGVSQFATTIYNAVFYGGYEDIEHTPHSIYISRYPECNEATISWPQPDLVFRNNTDAILIIDTSYTDTSITVKFFGNNGGISVERVLGGRTNITEPVERFIPNPEITPGEQDVKTSGSQGWTVSCQRIITRPDGSQTVDEWTHRYRGEVREIEVHPCDMPDSTQECPAVVPPLGGLTLEGARAAAAAVGLNVVAGPPVIVTPESGLAGLVAAHNPLGGDLLAIGGTITVNLGQLAQPPPTSSTTTTTVAGSTTSSTTTTTVAP